MVKTEKRRLNGGIKIRVVALDEEGMMTKKGGGGDLRCWGRCFAGESLLPMHESIVLFHPHLALEKGAFMNLGQRNRAHDGLKPIFAPWKWNVL